MSGATRNYTPLAPNVARWLSWPADGFVAVAPGPPAPPASAPVPQPPARYGAGLSPDLVYPWDPPGQQPRRPRWGRRLLLAFGLLVAVLAVALAVRGLIFVTAVSTEPVYAAHFWPFGGQRQANLLVLGYGGQGHEGGYLTDSLLLLSSDLDSRRTAQISVPRDLWVQVPPDSGRYAKINTAYSYGVTTSNGDPVAGGRLATTKVSQVTGLPVERWVTIDFRGFRALVDALGGVDLDVERSFASRYPANDDPTIDPSWTTVSFTAGRQHMDGETAIRYARARYADNPDEASDFARSRRQQRLIGAIGARLTSPTSWWRAFAVLNALQPALRTNLAPLDMLAFFLRADPQGGTRIALDDGNVLANGRSEDGQDILIPRGDDYSAIARYIREQRGPK